MPIVKKHRNIYILTVRLNWYHTCYMLSEHIQNANGFLILQNDSWRISRVKAFFTKIKLPLLYKQRHKYKRDQYWELLTFRVRLRWWLDGYGTDGLFQLLMVKHVLTRNPWYWERLVDTRLTQHTDSYILLEWELRKWLSNETSQRPNKN